MCSFDEEQWLHWLVQSCTYDAYIIYTLKMVYYDSKLIPAALVSGFWAKKLLNNQNYSIDSKQFLTVLQ